MVADPIDEGNTKPTPGVRSKIFNVYLRLRKVKNKFAIIAVLFAILANLASIPGHIETVRIFLFKTFGIEDAALWHACIAFLIGVVLLGSYLFLAFWLYKQSIAAQPQRTRRFYGTLVFVGAVALFGFNVYAVIPPAPDVPGMVKNVEGDLRKTLLQQQVNEPLVVKQAGESADDDSGGFQFAQNGGPHDAQVWTTAQVLYALEMGNPIKPEVREAIRRGFAYIERMRISVANGPCQASGQQDGWGYLKSLPWGVTEINSWVLLAKIASLRTNPSPAIWSDSEIGGQLEGIKSDLAALARRQHSNGGWAPIAKTDDDTHLRTYSTVMALWALIEAKHSIVLNPIVGHVYDRAITDGARWLIMQDWQAPNDNPDDRHIGGWWPTPSWTEKDAFPGLTAQAIYVLELVRQHYRLPNEEKFHDEIANFIRTSTGEIGPGNSLRARDVTDNPRPHDSDRYLTNQPYTVEQSTFLWYPWAIAAFTELKEDNSIKEDKRAAAELWRSTLGRVIGYGKFAGRDPVIYPSAEGLLALEISDAGSP
jgi:hypothetical protein